MDENTSNTASNIGTSKQFRASVSNSGSTSCRCGQSKTATIIMEGNGVAKENICVSVHPTTGGQFELRMNLNESIETLKKLISRKLKVPKERICLLYRDRHLREGTLGENELIDGCRVILLPSVESGLLAQRPEQSVMQALENLNDSQVTDFLSGKAPLNLTMRLGDHMMLIQLQLSTVAPNQSRKSSSGSSSTPKTVSSSTNTSPASSPPNSTKPNNPKGANTPLTSPWLTKSHSAPVLNACDAQGHKPQCCEHEPCSNECADNVRTLLDTKALAEASRNLTQTLKQLSSEVLTGKHGDTDNGCEVRLDTTKQKTVTSRTQTVVTDFSNSKESASKLKQGAIIESMHHHGKGVYSGTFSGTLNPALQDKHGRPKRDISTIIHILNDLLCATPQYRQQSASSQSRPATPPEACSPDVSLSDESWRIDQENQATRGKMEQLRLIMSERQARRRARRQQRQPYTWSAKSETSVKTETDDRGREEASSQGYELNPEPMVA